MNYISSDSSTKFNFLRYIHFDAKKQLSDFDVESENTHAYYVNKKKIIPQKLYRYYKPISYSFDALRNGYVWGSDPSKFNDPFECDYHVDSDGYLRLGLSSKLSSQKFKENSINHFSYKEYCMVRYGPYRTSRNRNDLWNLGKRIFSLKSEKLREFIDESLGIYRLKLLKIQQKIKKKNFFVVSFSEVANNSPMWAHYADNYSGFCVEYDMRCLSFPIDSITDENSTAILNRLFPIQYTQKKHTITKMTLWKYPDPTSHRSVENVVIKALCTKDNSWGYEREWRLLIDRENKRIGRTIDFPYVKKVICGFNMNRKNIEEIHNICIKNSVEMVILYKNFWNKDYTELSYENYMKAKEQESLYIHYLFR